MKSKFFKVLPVIAAVISLSFSAGAFATNGGNDDDGNDNGGNNGGGSNSGASSDTTHINLTKDVTYKVNGNYTVDGKIKTDAQAMALTDSKQSISSHNITNHQILNQAGVEDSSFKDASGLANVNAGAGTGFAQDNKVAISVLKGGKNASLDAETFGEQKISNITIKNDQNDNFSVLKNDAFKGFSGLANVNIGTGSSFLQANEVAISTGDGVSAVATTHDIQDIRNLKIDNKKLADAYCPPSDHPNYLLNTPQNNAKVQNAFAGASGLLNLNIGAGNGFAQSNNVAISSVSMSH